MLATIDLENRILSSLETLSVKIVSYEQFSN